MKNENKEGKGSKMKKALLVFASIIISIVISVMSTSFLDRFQETIDDIVNNELDSMVQDAVDSSIDDLETMEPDEQKYVSGVWLLNNELTRPEVNAPLEQSVKATLEWSLHTVNVSKFIIDDANFEYGSSYDIIVRTVSDDNDLDEQFGYLYLDSDSGWGGNFESRFWDFGDTPQAVSEEFYNWLIANAVQEGYVSGVWVFDESSPYSEVRMEQSVNFSFEVDGGVVNCNLMVADPGCLEYQPYTDEMDGTAAYDSSWCLSRTVDFGTTPQQVSVEFYQWLTAHATQQ